MYLFHPKYICQVLNSKCFIIYIRRFFLLTKLFFFTSVPNIIRPFENFAICWHFSFLFSLFPLADIFLKIVTKFQIQWLWSNIKSVLHVNSLNVEKLDIYLISFYWILVCLSLLINQTIMSLTRLSHLELRD